MPWSEKPAVSRTCLAMVGPATLIALVSIPVQQERNETQNNRENGRRVFRLNLHGLVGYRRHTTFGLSRSGRHGTNVDEIGEYRARCNAAGDRSLAGPPQQIRHSHASSLSGVDEPQFFTGRHAKLNDLRCHRLLPTGVHGAKPLVSTADHGPHGLQSNFTETNCCPTETESVVGDWQNSVATNIHSRRRGS